MNPLLSTARIRRFAPLLLVLASMVVAIASYLQALNYPFISDDATYITENAKLAELSLTKLWRLFVEPYNRLSEFLPLRTLSYWFDITLFGLNPAAFRLHNILLYLLCLPLVYATTLELWRYFRPADATSAPWAAATVTALFALHPVLVESVVWISGRKYVLPNLFSMLALWLAMRARREQGLSAPQAIAALVAFVAVMLSKASYVAVAPLIALLWVIFWFDIPKPEKRYSLLLWPLAILFLAGFMTLIFIAYNKGLDRIPFYFGIEAATRTLAVLGWLVRLAVSPENRHFFYPVLEEPYLAVMVALGGAVLAAAAIGAATLLRKRSLAGFSLISFLLLCMPYLQLIPYGAPSLASDRFLSLAIWPAILLLVVLSWRLKPMLRTALLLAVALPWSFQTIERPRDWLSLEAIIDNDLRAYPGYYMPALYKALSIQSPQELYREARDTANSITVPEFRAITAKLVEADYVVYADAISTGKPQKAMGLLWNLGLDLKQQPVQAKWNPTVYTLWERGRIVLTADWNYLAEQFPDDALVRYNTGLWMLETHRYIDAIAHLSAAIESQRLPEFVRGTAFKNLGLALINIGHVAEAETPLRTALEQSPPDLRAYCLLSKVHKQAGKIKEAGRAEANCPDVVPN